MCYGCSNNKKGNSVKKCAKRGKITCQKCAFSKCDCGSNIYNNQFTIK